MPGRRVLGGVFLAVVIAVAAIFGCKKPTPAVRAQAPPVVHPLPETAKAEMLPTGMTITPTAAAGSYFVPLNPDLPGAPNYVAGQPVTTAMSPDGKTLLVLTSGYNRLNGADGRRMKDYSNEYVFVFDVSQGKPQKTQVLQVPNTFDGIAWNPNGQEFYVSGGGDDDVHVFSMQAGRWSEAGAPIPLGHDKGLGIDTKPVAAGLAATADGKKLVVANFENDSVSVIDLATRQKTAELDLRPGKIDPKQAGVAGGEYPFWVVIKGNDTAYVSSPRDRQIVVVNISGEPKVTSRIAVPGEPTKMILDREQQSLYAALPSDDAVATIDPTTDKLAETNGTTAPHTNFANPGRLMGSNPNGLALSQDGRWLYVTNGGANSIALIDLRETRRNGVTGLIPTGWYPSAASVSADGKSLYVVNSKSMPGPNTEACRTTTSIARGALDSCYATNEYILQLNKGGFEVIPTPQASELDALTKQVAENDHYVTDARRADDEKMMAFLRQHIKHVIYIIKENRTYDQVLGDLPEGNGDPRLAILGKALGPNHHQWAQQFVDLDNFYCSGDVSAEGWNWSTAARASQFVENTYPINYADRGISYDFEGENRGINVGLATLKERRKDGSSVPDDEDLLPGTADVDAPDGPGGQAGTGYLWDAAERAKLSLRNYGFFLEDRYTQTKGGPPAIPVVRDPYAEKIPVAFPVKKALIAVTDPYFRGFDLKLPDYWRLQEWKREFQNYVTHKNLPSLELVRLMRDHFGDFAQAIDGTGTVEAEFADNDYAVGKLIETVAKSPYRDSAIICIVEDDAQNGPDHVDAHRSPAFIVGAYVKQGAVVSTHYTTVNMLKTIEEVLGMGPMGINDDVVEPMADVFTTELKPWTYTAIVPDVLRTTKLPLASAPAGGGGSADAKVSFAAARPRHDAAYWAAKTKGMDFSVEDHIDSAKFNRIIWEGLEGDSVPYPTLRDGRNLREDRKQLLQKFDATGSGERSAARKR
ncbi:MAG TPA: bifunctional YncE family protein/alkaline phosphatase family protein [Candidatus Acidoferrales bacterium]|nr:bifunctional YncE family protein/alkaline phosphatase family protein [Candidatus Acidoferrales bacterium]